MVSTGRGYRCLKGGILSGGTPGGRVKKAEKNSERAMSCQSQNVLDKKHLGLGADNFSLNS